MKPFTVEEVLLAFTQLSWDCQKCTGICSKEWVRAMEKALDESGVGATIADGAAEDIVGAILMAFHVGALTMFNHVKTEENLTTAPKKAIIEA